jgi:dienelactone hydrolase
MPRMRMAVLVGSVLAGCTAAPVEHAALGAPVGTHTAAPRQRIAIPTEGRSSAPAPLTGYLYRPAGRAPHPAVVMLHGCGGAFGRRGNVNARHAMWGEYLASLGYAALLVDSFGARGVTLNAIGRARPLQAFAAAVAFYPGCTGRSANVDGFHPYAPLLVLMGEADDWTPAAPCHALAQAVAARGEPMILITYPDTYHDFDNPALRALRVRHEVPNGIHPGAGVTIAPNAAAREDAKRRVAAFLAQALQ